ncbi:MAG: PglZ domain protein [Candidatus Hinthialibacteria bacterium OLB16]|nr:MAG: PglZ domain protein [Candidatus Hinthialibacteria bacterium OLB16]
MSSWRDQILSEFSPKIARLTLVADPDCLLLEEAILEGIRERGYELISFDDHAAFRYAYESTFRSRWDRGEQTDLVVVLRAQGEDLSTLPFDLLQAGRTITFSLVSIFPNLCYPVLAALDRGDLDTLYEAHEKFTPGSLGENATKEFVLRHVFEIAPELIKQVSDLLHILMRRHYRGERIPGTLDDRLILVLRQTGFFDEWPLESIVSNREAFFEFLQERWPIFLNQIANTCSSSMEERHAIHLLKYSGPTDLPFDHHDIKVYIDNLFVEGFLHAVSHEQVADIAKTWAVIGVKVDPAEDRSRRLSRLIPDTASSIPAEDARYGDWCHFARKWAELSVIAHNGQLEMNTQQKIGDLQARIDNSFNAWIARRYAGLVNLPPVPPVMVHHIPRFLSRSVAEDRNLKIALLVIDGLALDQWIVMRDAVLSRKPDLHFRENFVFAWIPSITSVSRQAIFAGKPPIYFPHSILSTEKEPALWAQFWMGQGFMRNQVVYEKGLGDGKLDQIVEIISQPGVRVAGLVVDKIDKILHGMELGMAGMHNQVRQWALLDYLGNLLDVLQEHGFRVWIASDHGNVEAEGLGKPSEGVMADAQGQRVRVYPNDALRRSTKLNFPAAIEWVSTSLPETFVPLIAPQRFAFCQEGARTVCHGGATIEELIVPFVAIE